MLGVAYADTLSVIYQIIQGYAGYSKSESIYGLYMIPKILVEKDDWNIARYYGQNNPKVIDYEINKPLSIQSYVPKNNKLLTYPFNCLEISNNNGSSNILRYEYFSSNKATFKIKGVPTMGGSIKLIPYTYNRFIENEEEGIMAGKWPTLNWSGDEFLSWQVQEGVNLANGIKTSALQILGGAVASSAGLPIGPGLIGAGIGNIGSNVINHMQAKNIHELTPDSARGNTNGGNINVCSGKNGFYFINKQIKEEFARIIDKFFTMKGYQVNELKTPNITSRTYFNYLEISNESCLGYGSIPEKYMNIINNIARKGVTIWHNHANIGNYNLNNTIIQ